MARLLFGFFRRLARLWDRLRLLGAERREADEALREREAHLRAILDTAVDAIIIIDERGLIQLINPATERMFGYTG